MNQEHVLFVTVLACLRVGQGRNIVATNALQQQSGKTAAVTKKDEANDWFDAAMRAGKLARDSSREILSKKRNESEIDCDNE